MLFTVKNSQRLEGTLEFVRKKFSRTIPRQFFAIPTFVGIRFYIRLEFKKFILS